MIAGLNPTDTRIADGQGATTPQATDGGEFAALLQPLSPRPAGTGSSAESEGASPAQPTDAVELTPLAPGAELRQTTEPSTPAPAAAGLGLTASRRPTDANAGRDAPADEAPGDGLRSADSGKPLPPAGNTLQPPASLPVSGREDLPAPVELAVADGPAAGALPGPLPQPAIPQNSLRNNGPAPSRGMPVDTAVAATRPAVATAAALEPRSLTQAADNLSLADDSLPAQSQSQLSSGGLVTATGTATPGGQGAAHTALASALVDTDAGASFATSASGEAAGRPTQDAPGAERVPRLPIQQFAGQPGWGEEVRSNLQWLSRHGIHRAELQLHPAELGSIDVRITTENDQASVVFFAANRTARELLEAELPRLRELFSQAGVELTQADVSEQRNGEAWGSGQSEHDSGHSSTLKKSVVSADSGNEAVGSLTVDTSGAQHLIDYYI